VAAFPGQEYSCSAGIFLSYQNRFFFIAKINSFSMREKVAAGRMRGLFLKCLSGI